MYDSIVLHHEVVYVLLQIDRGNNIGTQRFDFYAGRDPLQLF